MDPSSDSGATGINKSELKIQELVVGAWRFELQTSCAQGRRATRLRYAPTNPALDSSVFCNFLSTAPQELLLNSIIYQPFRPTGPRALFVLSRVAQRSLKKAVLFWTARLVAFPQTRPCIRLKAGSDILA